MLYFLLHLNFMVFSKLWLFLEIINSYIIVQTEDILVKKRLNVSTGTIFMCCVCIYRCVYMNSCVCMYLMCVCIQYITNTLFMYVKCRFMYRILTSWISDKYNAYIINCGNKMRLKLEQTFQNTQNARCSSLKFQWQSYYFAIFFIVTVSVKLFSIKRKNRGK